MCAHDHDRFRLPSASPPQKSEAGKKESTDRRLSQAYQRCVTPSSNSSLDCRRNVARTAEGGFATHSGVSKSAKVVLGSDEQSTSEQVIQMPTSREPNNPRVAICPPRIDGHRTSDRG